MDYFGFCLCSRHVWLLCFDEPTMDESHFYSKPLFGTHSLNTGCWNFFVVTKQKISKNGIRNTPKPTNVNILLLFLLYLSPPPPATVCKLVWILYICMCVLLYIWLYYYYANFYSIYPQSSSNLASIVLFSGFCAHESLT